MTHNELRWAQSQSWWNDFTNIYKRSAKNINFETYIEKVSLEMVPIYLIGDANLNDTDNIILVRIANACLDHVEIPGLGEYSKPVVRKFRYDFKEERVATVDTDSILLQTEKGVLYKELENRGVHWDSVKDSGKRLIFFKTTKVLKEI